MEFKLMIFGKAQLLSKNVSLSIINLAESYLMHLSIHQSKHYSRCLNKESQAVLLTFLILRKVEVLQERWTQPFQPLILALEVEELPPHLCLKKPNVQIENNMHILILSRIVN